VLASVVQGDADTFNSYVHGFTFSTKSLFFHKQLCRNKSFLKLLPIFSGITDRGQGGEPPPWKAKCKNWAPSS